MYLLSISLLVFTLVGCGSLKTEVPEETPTTGNVSDIENEAVQVKPIVQLNQEGDHLKFHISLVNQGKEDVELTFPSGQRFEIFVNDSNGREVYRYSINRSFIQVIEEVILKAGEELSWEEEWDLTMNGEEVVPSGEYTATVEITAHSDVDIPLASQKIDLDTEKK